MPPGATSAACKQAPALHTTRALPHALPQRRKPRLGRRAHPRRGPTGSRRNEALHHGFISSTLTRGMPTQHRGTRGGARRGASEEAATATPTTNLIRVPAASKR